VNPSHETLQLSAHDQRLLSVEHYQVSAPGGVVIFLHGLSEHARRHELTALQLCAAGYAVMAPDMRGHGRSEGPRGGLTADEDPLDDLASVFDLAARLYPGTKRILMGNSIGGAIASRYAAAWAPPTEAARWMRAVDGLILSSPALQASMSLIQKTLLTGVGSLMPDIALPAVFKPEWLNSDPAVVAEFYADPYAHRCVTPRLARFVASKGQITLAKARRWRTPTLLMFSPNDRLISARACEDFAAAVPKGLLHVCRFPEMVHDLLREPQRQQVWDAMRAWLHQLEKPPSA
jgi:alpha-beta hydrolase superfamily lysophospholipase